MLRIADCVRWRKDDGGKAAQGSRHARRQRIAQGIVLLACADVIQLAEIFDADREVRHWMLNRFLEGPPKRLTGARVWFIMMYNLNNLR